jgi:4-aminobutyrate aminotransferase-like enzyme/Ser/Thr protein kinase RdoA (MazF antagonist)
VAVADPLVEPRPSMDPDVASRILASHYGIEGELVELHGERDLNFRVDLKGTGRRLLKIHNPADPPEVVEMRTLALDHIRAVDPTLPVPRTVRTSSGETAVAVTAADGRVSQVQVFTFLDGRHADCDELDETALYEWGRCVARLGRALRGYFHPAAGYPIQWDVRHAPALRDRLGLLDPRASLLVDAVLRRFDERVAPRLPRLRAQVIHNDMSRANVLVDERGRVVGITDFGDMTQTALVCDLAVAVADVLCGRPDFLDAADPLIAGYCTVTPLETTETAVLGDLVAARAATDVVVTTWRTGIHEHESELPTASVGTLVLFEREGFTRVAARFERASALLPYPQRPTEELAAARRRVLGVLELSYDEPLHVVGAEGVHLVGADGRRYLDAYNNVPVVGHCHPAVTAAIAAQAKRLITNTRYLQEAAVELGERLLRHAPGHLDRALFVNSGSEANDLAWRIARFSTGHGGALVTRFAYHGVTEATTDLSPEVWPEGYAPEHVALLTPPASPERPSDAPATVGRMAEEGTAVAALFVDPAFTSDGILGPARDWVRSSAAAVREAGGLVVADEVQAGYGRTGDHLWSIAATGLDPDLMTLGKPMGNGFPVAAVLGRADLIDPFVSTSDFFSTFGGNTLACAAALAVLDVVEREGILEHAASTGTYLRGAVGAVATGHDVCGDVRGWGLLCGLDVLGPGGAPDARRASSIVNRLRSLGVLVGTTGPSGNVLKIRPPLVFGPDDADQLATCLDEALLSAV